MIILRVLCGLTTILFYFVYRWLTDRYNFWKKLKIPYVPATPFLGNLKEVILGKAHLMEEFDRIYNSFPDESYVGFFEFLRPHLMIKDPELIEHILIKDFNIFSSRGVVVDETLDPLEAHLANLDGPRWKILRNKIIPTFSSGKLKLMSGLVKECAKDLDNHLSDFAENGNPIDIRETMAKFTTDVIGRCAFGLDFNTLQDPNSEYREIGKIIFTNSYSGVIKNLIRIINPNILHCLRIKTISKYVNDFFVNLLEKTMALRKKDNIQRNDFMQLMITIRDQEILQRNTQNKSGEETNNQLEFTDNLIAANMFVFYAAGFETTASTLGFIFYELALNPGVQEKLRDEINKITEDHNGILSFDAVQNIKYMEMVILETLRMFDPAPFTGRESVKEYELPGSSIVIPPRTRITIPIYSIHHDPKYYPEPDQFIPERFSKENVATRPTHTFLPFGDGPRICIGLRFAKLEIKICLAHIIRKYQFDTCEETITPVRLNRRSILYTPDHGITLAISKI